MLALLGFLTLAVFTYLVMAKRMIAFSAIVVVPVVFALIGGFGLVQIGDMMMEGVQTVAKTAVLLLFAILYFGIMMESGLFDPLSEKLIKIAKGDPVKIAIGTAILALLCALDGDGTTTYMIVCSAMLPIYRRMGMNPLVLATVSIMSLGIIAGMTPWGGSATRAISILEVDPSQYFNALIPTMLLGAVWILLTAYVMGRSERKRIGILTADQIKEYESELSGHAKQSKSWVLWFNLFLTIAMMAVLIMDVVPLSMLFLVGFIIALAVNFPKIDDQKKVLKAHAPNAIPVVSLVLAAGAFTGILSDTKMVDEMANVLVNMIPESMGGLFTVIVAVASLPLSFFMSNDAFFFGVLPVLAKTAAQYGVDPIEVGRASIVGQAIHLIGPTSAPLWVLIELIRSDLGKLQKYTFIPIVIGSIALIVFALATGAISIH